MRSKQIVCGLVVVALMGGVSSRVMAQAFPWWAFDSVIEEVQDRGDATRRARAVRALGGV